MEKDQRSKKVKAKQLEMCSATGQGKVKDGLAPRTGKALTKGGSLNKR